MSHLIPMAEIPINIVLPRVGIKRAFVNQNDLIRTLTDRIGGVDQEFGFKGQIIRQQCTFNDYNIKSGDSVVVINPRTNSATMIKNWVRMSYDAEGFEERMKWATNMDSQKEFFRPQDLHRIRIEASPRPYRRLYHQISIDRDECESGSLCWTTVIPDQSLEICRDPLPPIFSSDA
jgi:hypothetical protein